MVGYICKWVNDYDGLWWVAFAGILSNLPWALSVIDCDNPAFSMPPLMIGLYYYFHKDKKIIGSFLLLASSLFRPGAEIILLLLLMLEIYRNFYRIKIILVLGFTTLIGFIHSLYGTYLAYPTKQQFIDLCVTYYPEAQSEILKYKHSIHAIEPYLDRTINSITNFPIVLFLLIAIYYLISKKIQYSKLYIIIALVSSLLLPIGTFIYGTINNTDETKLMVYLFVIVFIASLYNPIRNISWLNKLIPKYAIPYLIIFLCIFYMTKGIKFHGKYEVNNNGSGLIPMKQRLLAEDVINNKVRKDTKLNVLITYSDLTFFVLDYGYIAKRIDFYEDISSKSDSIINYDLIMISGNISRSFSSDLTRDFISYDIGDDVILHIRKTLCT